MGYLNNQVVTIDAILTKKGRELLARGAAVGAADGSGFQITQFALSDDEIDYTLYNPNHPSGSAYYGEAIENMPLLEAFPDETQIMKYKLATLPRGTAVLPYLNVITSLNLNQNAGETITPTTNPGDANDVDTSYTFTVSDARLFSLFTTTTGENASTPTAITNGTSISQTVVGAALRVQATGVNTLFGTQTALYATLTIVGRQTGARVQIPITISKITTNQA
jgi:hypothetical protein|tara:strand:- start:1280 stop:1948 length:669 start_codon:yes stop_codon:yes gene_type:complete